MTTRINTISSDKSLQARFGTPFHNKKNKQNGNTSNLIEIKYNEYYIEDARHLGSLLNNSKVIDVTVTSPPYWNVKNYGEKSQIGYGQTLNQYLDDLVAVFTEVWHCTKRTGSLWVVINTVKKDQTLHLLPFKLAERLTQLPTAAWHLQDILIWVKPHTLPWSHKQKLQDHFEYVLCFSKSKSFSLNIDSLRSPQNLTNWWVKYPERYHPLGKGLNNVWEIHIPTQGSWGNGSMEHACPLPTELTKRIIQLASDKKGVVCDPFAGTGASVVAAHSLGRKWIAMDLNKRYKEMCHKRIAEECKYIDNKFNDENSLRETNLNLRQLKFPVLLYKRIAPGLRLTVEDVPLLVVRKGTSLRKPNPNWVTDGQIAFVVSDKLKQKKINALINVIKESQLVPPISKFQISTNVRVIRSRDLSELSWFSKKSKLNIYSCGHFWRSSKNILADKIDSIDNRSKFPTLVSDILANEEPAY